jgi:uncharacterized protein YbjT (DUF2867 family)
MRVGIFGATGFVGSYLVDALVEAGHEPVALVRAGHDGRLRHAERCELVSGDIGDDDAVARVAAQVQAVIYNIGILREFPRRGITFEGMQHEAVRRVVDAAGRHGAERFLLMSANGVERCRTAYQVSKRRGEQYLEASGLDWTIFRPSVIFGDPRGRMEFATQLKRDVIDSPAPAPLFYTGLLPTGAGSFEMSPVHVGDVARAFVTALARPETIGKTLELGGPARLSWRAILETIAEAGGSRKAMLPVPAFGVSTAALLLERFESFPLTRDQLKMLLEGNTCSSDDLRGLGIEPTPFDVEHLAYLRSH